MSSYQITTPPTYLSAASANALISDIQPTTVLPATLLHLNLFLDELLYLLLSAAQSLNPTDIRSSGVPAVFSADKSGESTAIRSLGRSAVGEAELELRSWFDGQEPHMKMGFGRDGKGNGMKRGVFTLQEAYGAMRGKCEEFSTLAGDEASDVGLNKDRTNAWTAVGGSAEDNVLNPSALYITAILEHVCEHVLSSLARVIGRDSDNSTAGVEDLFTAVAEDDGIWGFFKRMQVRISLEDAIKARQKRSRPADRLTALSSANPSYADSKTSLDQSEYGRASTSVPPSGSDSRPSQDVSRSGGVAGGAGSIRQSPTARFGPGVGPNRDANNRSPSILSPSTRNMIGAYNDQSDTGMTASRSKRDEEDDFDALVASGETMKVSLTPSRLKNFDNSRKSSPSNLSQTVLARRERPAGLSPPSQNDELPPLVPRNITPTGASLGDTPPRPPRSSSMRSRSGSNSASSFNQAKLQARGASIIAEQDPESEELADDLDPNYRQKRAMKGKESLAELLASTGPVQEGYEGGEGGAVKRTVPAVILGTAPPKFDDEPSTGTATLGPSVNRPSRPVVDSINTTIDPSQTKRTPAREMADFFNDGPPSEPNRSGPVPANIDTSRRPSAGKPKTPAQEMADFFNSTAPPPSAQTSPPMRYGAPVENIVAPPPKKGFRGFISKIGGGGSSSKDRKGSVDQSFEGIPTAVGTSGSKAGYQAQVKADASAHGQAQGLDGKRQKSMAILGPHGAGGGGSNAKSIAEAYRSEQQSKEINNNNNNPGVVLAPSIPTSITSPPQSSISTDVTPRSPPTTTLAGAIAAGGVAIIPSSPALSRKTSVRKPVPYTAGDSPEIPPSPTISDRALRRDSPLIPLTPGGRRKPSTVDEDYFSDDALSTGKEEEIISESSKESKVDEDIGREGGRTLKEEKSNDQLSFATAQETENVDIAEREEKTPKVSQGVLGGGVEGVDSVPEAAGVRSGVTDEAVAAVSEDREAIDSVPEAADIREDIGTGSTPIVDSSKEHETSPSSIQLSDLVPLRHLLNNATSVKECQMLLSAILTQWGVPLSEDEDGGDDSEHRIAAWLLAGRDGPVGDIGRSTKKNEVVEGEKEVSSIEPKGEEGPTVGGIVQDMKTLATEGLAKVL